MRKIISTLLALLAVLAVGAGMTVVALTNGTPVAKDGSVSAFDRIGRAFTAAEVAARDRRYAANASSGRGEPDAVHWVDRTDSSPLVIVAPHAVNHHRDGEPKPADRYTGPIAEILARRLGASVLTTTGEVSDWNEQWDDRDDEFTRILHDLPDEAIIIDLHGMADSSAAEPISLGTGKKDSGPSMEIAEGIKDSFGGAAEINETFTAKAAYTDTRHMQGRGHDALQVEMAQSMRNPGDLNVGYTIDALEGALESLH
ncbi:hypothetical protein [Corynebacterium liangguodongii]|uniref:Uncharacterized protein n=1 Tax=Corynebacterium liangguodongii TaxID=2079535 RepID=A0A2S0WDA6_9CORY|nr:hypothetical protein [Corynebacterium liangguodongii]AWB83753.1 hypothetical protein C3E79_04010 [Corynebacterium liangguodongii]PWB99437.1 hypothetical protein DF219_05785 [Corynebacterium liangguodongii]